MGPFLIAWLVGMGLNISHNTYSYKVDRSASPLPPKPGNLLIASGIYVGLAVLAEAPSMRSTATLTAWGYNVAIALRWAQEYSANQAQIKTYPGSLGGASGSAFWKPPAASGDVLFPNGTGGSPNAKPASATSTLTSGTGTQVA